MNIPYIWYILNGPDQVGVKLDVIRSIVIFVHPSPMDLILVLI
jgi:hypothetical protein